MSWKKIGNVKEKNIFLAQNNVPIMLLNSVIDRNIQNAYLAMRTYQFKELDSELNTVNDLKDKIQKELDTARSNYARDPSLTGLKRLVENVASPFYAYIENVDKVFAAVSKKNELLKNIEAVGKELDTLAKQMVEMQYNELKTDACQETRVLRRLDRIKASVSISVAVTGLQGKIRSAAARGDVEEIQSTEAIIDDIVTQCEALRQETVQANMQAPMAKLEETGIAYQKAIDVFVDAYTNLQELHRQRLPLVAKLQDNATEEASSSQNNVKAIAEDSMKNLGNAMNILLTSTLAAIVLGLCIAFFIAGGIAVPLGTIVRLAQRAGEGDLTIERKDFKYEGQDELGNLVDALSSMIASQEHAILEAVSVTKSVAEGADSLSAISDTTNTAMEEIKASIDQVSSLSEINGAALEECNAGVEEVSAGADTVAQSSTDSATFISQTTNASQKAIDTVHSVIEKMKDAHETSNRNEEKMRHLVEAVEKISGFVSVITGIANQTNLLALNAAIEAARAGDMGRGFAVVAEEVRKLAEESARSAQNVNDIIGLLQDSAQDSIATTTESGKLLTEALEQAERAQNELNAALSEMNKASDSIQNIAAVAQEQAASSKEVAAAIDSATRTTMEVVENIASIRRSSNSTVEAARNAAGQSQSMSQYARNLKEVLAQFKTRESPLSRKALRA
jgi:methyl-accepting chemotaxis protein